MEILLSILVCIIIALIIIGISKRVSCKEHWEEWASEYHNLIDGCLAALDANDAEGFKDCVDGLWELDNIKCIKKGEKNENRKTVVPLDIPPSIR